MTKNLPSQRTAVELAADSPKRSRLPEILRNWCHEIQAHGIAGVVVTVPDPLDPFVNRRCVAGAHPTSLLEALRNWNVVVMPTGQSMGRIADSAFTHTQLPALGLQSWACWRATMPFGHGQGMEVFMFSELPELPKNTVYEVAWHAATISTSLWRAAADAVIHITERERTCLQDAVLGKTAQETALALGVDTTTVSYHLNNAYKKLRGKGKTNAAMRALYVGCLGRMN